MDKKKKKSLADVVQIIMRSLENIESTLKKTFGVAGLEKEFTNRNAIVLNKFAQYMATIPEDSSAYAIIYYGAGHMPFLEEELCTKYNLTLEAEEWITAIVTDI